MKALAAALMLAASPVSPPPLVPMDEAPLSSSAPPWWAWAIAGTATAQMCSTIAIVLYVVLPLFFPPPPIPTGRS